MTNALLGSPFLAVAVFFLYEWIAVTWKIAPSISRLVSNQISPHPAYAFLEGFGVGAVCILLVLHFAGALPWWKP